MAGVKLIVAYPKPTNIDEFEKIYTEDHVPMAIEKLAGKTRIVATRVIGTPSGDPAPFYRIAEVHFPSMEAIGTGDSAVVSQHRPGAATVSFYQSSPGS